MASKWTGVYACAGIAVLFFTFLFQEYGTAAARTRKGMSGQAAISYLAGLSVICIAAYILIPAVIYVASYLSYGNGMGNGNVFQTMWENQQLMLHYHEETVFEHPYASEWYGPGLNDRFWMHTRRLSPVKSVWFQLLETR